MEDLMDIKVKWVVKDGLGRSFNYKTDKRYGRQKPVGMPIGKVIIILTVKGGATKAFESDPCMEHDMEDCVDLTMTKVRTFLRTNKWKQN